MNINIHERCQFTHQQGCQGYHRFHRCQGHQHTHPHPNVYRVIIRMNINIHEKCQLSGLAGLSGPYERGLSGLSGLFNMIIITLITPNLANKPNIYVYICIPCTRESHARTPRLPRSDIVLRTPGPGHGYIYIIYIDIDRVIRVIRAIIWVNITWVIAIRDVGIIRGVFVDLVRYISTITRYRHRVTHLNISTGLSRSSHGYHGYRNW